jgi:hypothetical protein
VVDLLGGSSGICCRLARNIYKIKYFSEGIENHSPDATLGVPPCGEIVIHLNRNDGNSRT